MSTRLRKCGCLSRGLRLANQNVCQPSFSLGNQNQIAGVFDLQTPFPFVWTSYSLRLIACAYNTYQSISMLPACPQLRIVRSVQQSVRRFSTNVIANEPRAQPRNSHHHDMPSFLGHASRTNLDPNSNVYVGTHYEYTAQEALERWGMSLDRIGGSNDYGIDLLGTWALPSMPQPLKVIIQCKASNSKSGGKGTANTRELEGSFIGAPQGWRGSGVLALLVSQRAATKGVREAFARSRWPMGYVYCTSAGKVLQMLWNKRAEEEGLAGINIGVKYDGGDIGEKEVVLSWKGHVLPTWKSDASDHAQSSPTDSTIVKQ